MGKRDQDQYDYYTRVAGASFGKNVMMDLFNTNDVEEATATVTYVGAETSTGGWLIKKIDTTSGTSIGYATRANNASVTNYTGAWTNRATLTYNNFSIAFSSS